MSDAAPFWEGCASGELRLVRCGACNTWHHLAPRRCPVCHSDNLQWARASGRGKIATFTIVHRAPLAALKDKTPYVLALIDLEEGARMMAHVKAPVGAVKIGAGVCVAFGPGTGGKTFPVFELATGAF